jgi:hypothetical protein
MTHDTPEAACPHGFAGPHSAFGMTPRAADDHCSGPGAWYPPTHDTPEAALVHALDDHSCVAHRFDSWDEPTWYEGLPGTLEQAYDQWRKAHLIA